MRGVGGGGETAKVRRQAFFCAICDATHAMASETTSSEDEDDDGESALISAAFATKARLDEKQRLKKESHERAVKTARAQAGATKRAQAQASAPRASTAEEREQRELELAIQASLAETGGGWEKPRAGGSGGGHATGSHSSGHAPKPHPPATAEKLRAWLAAYRLHNYAASDPIQHQLYAMGIDPKVELKAGRIEQAPNAPPPPRNRGPLRPLDMSNTAYAEEQRALSRGEDTVMAVLSDPTEFSPEGAHDYFAWLAHQSEPHPTVVELVRAGASEGVEFSDVRSWLKAELGLARTVKTLRLIQYMQHFPGSFEVVQHANKVWATGPVLASPPQPSPPQPSPPQPPPPQPPPPPPPPPLTMEAFPPAAAARPRPTPREYTHADVLDVLCGDASPACLPLTIHLGPLPVLLDAVHEAGRNGIALRGLRAVLHGRLQALGRSIQPQPLAMYAALFPQLMRVERRPINSAHITADHLMEEWVVATRTAAAPPPIAPIAPIAPMHQLRQAPVAPIAPQPAPIAPPGPIGGLPPPPGLFLGSLWSMSHENDPALLSRVPPTGMLPGLASAMPPGLASAMRPGMPASGMTPGPPFNAPPFNAPLLPGAPSPPVDVGEAWRGLMAQGEQMARDMGRQSGVASMPPHYAGGLPPPAAPASPPGNKGGGRGGRGRGGRGRGTGAVNLPITDTASGLPPPPITDAASALPPPPLAATPGDDTSCVVCCDQERTHALIPCGHLCLCTSCSEMIVEASSSRSDYPLRCPVCREPCETAMRVFT